MHYQTRSRILRDTAVTEVTPDKRGMVAIHVIRTTRRTSLTLHILVVLLHILHTLRIHETWAVTMRTRGGKPVHR